MASDWLRDSPGEVFALFREHPEGLSTSDAVEVTGLSRTALLQRIGLLRDAGFLADGQPSVGRVGRPGMVHTFAADRGYVLVADTGTTGMRLALGDASGDIVAETYRRFAPGAGPREILGGVLTAFSHVLHSRRLRKSQVLGIGISVPGPVDQSTSRVVRPPSMAGWHDFDIVGTITAEFDCPVVVETDANAMAFGEHRRRFLDVDNLIFFKLGTGLSAGLVLNRRIFRGTDGSAGDVGHTQWYPGETRTRPACRCGNRGCLEAFAGGWALARDLADAGIPAESVDDVVAAVRQGNQIAGRLVREAALKIGTAMGDMVNLLNPGTVVLGGQLSALDEIVLAAIRERVYQRALPLATRNLSVVTAQLIDPGVHGLALLVSDHLHTPTRVDEFLKTRS